VAAVSPGIDAAPTSIAERLRLRRAVAIVESSAVVVPTLVGYVKPLVLLSMSVSLCWIGIARKQKRGQKAEVAESGRKPQN
jgi:hypothetical protein